MLRFEGHNYFRQRLLLATLSNQPVRIDKIRSEDEDHPGLADYEASFLRLLEKATNGATIEISYTGTTVVYRPGVIIGGKVHHDCPPSRAIGYFLEPMIALGPFGKYPLQLTLTGITNDNVDVSVDSLRTVLLPHLRRFGVEEDLELKISKRGAPPKGGGEVFFRSPIVRQLKPVQFIEEGQIKRIRGIAYATRISPQMANRTVEASRSMLTQFIPDVYIYTDVYKGPESGLSPGYALTLVAESTTGALLSAECAFQPRRPTTGVDNGDEASTRGVEAMLVNDYHFATPEDLGVHTTRVLLEEIKKGGCFDTVSQWLGVLFLALGPEDVGKIRIAKLSPFTIQYLRDIKTFLGLTFKITPDHSNQTVILTCLGVGYTNVNKRVA
ncbi:18S rRNA biogenesis protein RCL1 [Spizellomyces punctatus DAOM BR117]|uniref:18S rRNA biogenesis protein RCL1 n=1 Tax=Spizellomyces punctatus (strain DAOM BR117) TaxID=645134 RepID=A0A0L0HTW2_SPIPD|nr:18S rRNA biogenesis protein RCL1 [Spizellomyces punctatus DAOM BR117]KND04309.1 18S rRNA biogenesis protein RCL1 [Spizellomyces punctatus DAOM BR117]|eukprot:XP_016612348.1 18S rRNA biogenesis protein RCL1 [Spizellomyces punctatus DAOM BR117]